MDTDWKSLVQGIGSSSGGGSGGRTAQSEASADVDYGTTDRSRNNPWPIVAVVGAGILGAVVIVAVVFGGSD